MISSNSNKLYTFYKYHITLFLKLILLLILIGLFERSIFSLFHNYLSTEYSLTEIIYTLLWGVKFDMALAGFFGVIYVLIAYLLERLFSISGKVTLKYLVYIFSSVIFILQSADIIYFSDASRHLGYEITDTFNDAPQLLATAWSVYKFPLFTHLALYPILILIIYKLFNHSNLSRTTLSGFKKVHLEIAYFSLLIISLLLVRGGTQPIPLEPLHAQEISDSSKASLALNGAYNTIHYLFTKNVIEKTPIKLPKNIDINTTFNSLYKSRGLGANNKNENWQPNIVFIFLESWPAMHMQSYGYEKSTTPFFDQLRNKSLTSLEMLAGGHRTTEGLFSSLCSIQNPLGKTIAQTHLQDYKYQCLPHGLRSEGYETMFFQGSNKNTSGTGAFAQSLGFTKSYGRTDITTRNYEENHWGVYDQDLYNHVYEKIKKIKPPFFVGINTNTTHDVRLPNGVNPQFKIDKSTPAGLNPLYFADVALKEFFNKIENDELIKDTLWIIISDHTAGLKTSRLNNYRIPFLIYHKNNVKAQKVNRVVSQRDIAPTVLNIMNLNVPQNFTGKNLLSTNNPPYFADYYHSGIIGWIEDDLLLEVSISDPTNYSCFNYLTDKLLKNKINCPKGAILQRDHALAFTVKNQNVIFNGNGLKNIITGSK